MQPLDLKRLLSADPEASARVVTPVMSAMIGSRILKVAAEVRALQAQGREICNLTVGDFSPKQFPVPELLARRTAEAVLGGQTNYPPADGIPELKAAISDYYRDELGLDYGPQAVCVASGARPPIYATWRLFVEPGDRTVSFLPAWNVGYYAHLLQADHQFVPTTAETNFFPTVEQFAQAVRGARLAVINSPLNPTGTVISEEVLRGIAEAVVEENRHRPERPLILLYDQVYWMLTAKGVHHHNPVRLVPEVAPYVVQVDAISKSFAATGLRVGWGVLPPSLQKRMSALIGHMGAWAGRPEQAATAAMLNDRPAVDAYMEGMRERVAVRLDRLYAGFSSMHEEGLPVRAIAPQGAIYLSLKFDLVGRGFDDNESIRRFLLEEAGTALVPFQAFDLMEESGWFRASIGAVGVEEIDHAIERVRAALHRRGV